MIVGVGVDITKVSRFEQWAFKPRRQLERVLTPAEIDYCLASPANSAQRFAARWAAKEAYFKALPEKGSFLQIARAFDSVKPNPHLSISHEQEYAIAFVLLYNPPISPIL